MPINAAGQAHRGARGIGVAAPSAELQTISVLPGAPETIRPACMRPADPPATIGSSLLLRRACQTLDTNGISNGVYEPGLSGEIIMEMYEVQLCRRGRWDQQHWRVVAARDEGEAAYKVTGERLRKEGERRKIRVRVIKLGNRIPPATVFYAA
jgi:hypothetical protein